MPKIDYSIKEKLEILEITTFGIKDIKNLILIISKENNDKKILEDYENGKLICSVCNKNISKNINNIGGIIKNKIGRWILLCRDLNCYNRALSK